MTKKKENLSKHSRVNSSHQIDIRLEAFKQAFVTHRNAVTTATKRTLKTIGFAGREKEEKLKEDLERNVTLCLYNSFCRNMQTNIDPLSCCRQRLEISGVAGLPPSASEWPPMCCKTEKPKV